MLLTGKRHGKGYTYEEDRLAWIQARLDPAETPGKRLSMRVRLGKAYDKLVLGWNVSRHTARYVN